MKRLSLLGFVGLLAGILGGCPIWPGDGDGCVGDCGVPVPGQCWQPSDCYQNETCGADWQCHSGDCTWWGCVDGFTCQVNSNRASCQPDWGTGGAGAGGAGVAGGATGGAGTGGAVTGGGGTGGTPVVPVYCGHPADCVYGEICGSAGTCVAGPCSETNPCVYGHKCATNGDCVAPTPDACDMDTDCDPGALCIAGSDGKGGVCTVEADQCFDGSQCGVAQSCVEGKCTLTCQTTADCRDGFLCDPLDICSIPSQTCVVTNDCGSADLVCVGGACVPRSKNGACGPGDVWTENGCIPNQAASFICQAEGQQDACAAGSICLQHSCWISCEADPNVCPAKLPSCKTVALNASVYRLCGGDESLGNECGAGAMGHTCAAGKICIDGYCK